MDKKLNKILYSSSFINLNQLKEHLDENYNEEIDSKLLLNYALGIPSISENMTIGLLKSCISIIDGDYKKASRFIFENFPKYDDCEPYEKFARLDYMNILMNYLGLKGNLKFNSDEKIKESLYKMYNKEYVDDVINLCSTPSKLINVMFVQREHPLSLMDWGLYFAQADAFNRIYREKEKGNIEI